MLILKRNCPSCGTKKLPVFVFRRNSRRICDGCGVAFRERYRPLWLSDLVIVCIIIGYVLLLVDILPQDVKDYLGAGGFILTIIVSGIIAGGVVPAYLLNRTVPLKVTGGRATTDDQPYPDSEYQYPVVVLILLALAAFSFRSCLLNISEGEELIGLSIRREQLLPDVGEILNDYKELNGCYPEKLEELVPFYMDVLPAPLDPLKTWKHPESSIFYKTTNVKGNCSARFYWSMCSGSDCTSRFDVNTGEFSHELDLVIQR
jgi:hypothetical protein